MPDISKNEVRRRLTEFSKQWRAAKSEKSQAQTFWLRFYECFGIRAESATIYEQAVKKLDGASGYIDSFIPGKLIVEHKSAGKDLDAALEQASDYFLGLKETERPRYIITSDFSRLRLHDLRSRTNHECTLAELPKRASWFEFLVDDAADDIVEESPINRQAAYAVSRLHEGLLRAKFKGRDLEIFLTRLLFCFFADDTGIFGQDGMFRKLVERTRSDGRDLGTTLAELFETLDTSEEDRQHNLDGDLAAFSYVNGSLFEERTRIPSFDSDLRKLLVQCAELDWSGISPAIFGAMFQGVLDAHNPTESRQASRRELGAHYTSERNILRAAGPLFLDDLRTEFAAARRSKPKLKALYEKLPTLTLLDPACGCGNFLVIAFRELRRLEIEVIAELFDFDRVKGLLDVSTLCRVRVNQFYGIEIDEAAAHIARVAMWITDHQLNLEAAQRFGTTRPTVPLVDSPTIVHANALRHTWADVLPAEKCSYILGNPPFAGKKEQSESQKADMKLVAGRLKGSGVLDYVSCWYVKALEYLKANSAIQVAFVSTNSITQGEQVSVLWEHLLKAGVRISFAHRTFKWSNEGKGNAAVHCVIVGFGVAGTKTPRLFEYSDPKAEPTELAPARINPYLTDAPDVLMQKRSKPICAAPAMNYGSMPIDNGHLALTDQERAEVLSECPEMRPHIKSYIGGEEFLNGGKRYCLWLVDADPKLIRKSALVSARIKACREYRVKSDREATQELAKYPHLFGEIRQPVRKYLVVPKVSSEFRDYMPIGFVRGDVIASGSLLVIPDATTYHFGILTSHMHMAWMRSVCGRLESRYQYSARIVYNNFPWPTSASETQRRAVEAAGQCVLDARAAHSSASLADLYDPAAMPTDLRRAHEDLDKAVDAAYGFRGKRTDAFRAAFLFRLFESLVSPVTSKAAKAPRARRTAVA